MVVLRPPNRAVLDPGVSLPLPASLVTPAPLVTSLLATFSVTSSCPVFVAPYPLQILAAEMTSWASAVAANDVAFWSMQLRKYNLAIGTGGNIIATKTTKITGGEAIVQRAAWNFDASAFDPVQSVFAKGDCLGMAAFITGAAPAISQPSVTVRFVPL